ncbi:hypothetical protein [Chitinophaga varians]|uniref:hypothetical protein n=1 Tax=Chitinophaga varians TaxID=2202339 RepID=UPI00165F4CAD|nr:hypothetical protein [Chitinophaga varians]MBC9913007.1 hypothetical protein [Chitinophaga varians]
MKACLFAFTLGVLCCHATYAQTKEIMKTATPMQVQGTTVNDFEDPGAKIQLMTGGMTINGGLNNQDSRPPLTAGTGKEIRARSRDHYGLDDGFLRLTAGGGTNVNTKSFIELSGYSLVPEMNQNIVLGTGATERMRINPNGYVGIGTSTPQSLLAVAGVITATEVRIVPGSTSLAATNVFDATYVLPSLETVEKHIQQNKRLPDTPADAEMTKGGMSLGSMQQQQMKKINELTLYLIEQNKKIEKLQQQLLQQEARIKELEKK